MLVSLLIFKSCSTEELEEAKVQPKQDIKAVNGRLSFPSTKSYFETLTRLDNMTPEEISQFVMTYKFPSLRDLVDTVGSDIHNLKSLPPAYQAILNRSGEVIIGDTIVGTVLMTLSILFQN